MHYIVMDPRLGILKVYDVLSELMNDPVGILNMFFFEKILFGIDFPILQEFSYLCDLFFSLACHTIYRIYQFTLKDHILSRY